MRRWLFSIAIVIVAAFLAAPMTCGLAAAAEDADASAAEDMPEVKPLVWSGTVNLGMFLAHRAFFGGNPYFGAEPEDTDFGWMEAFARLQLEVSPSPWMAASVGAAVFGTGATDYYGLRNDGSVLLDRAQVSFPSIGDSDFSLAVGRQDIVIGDGFIIGDGYLDHEGALWTMPLSFFDAARVDFETGGWHVTAMGALLSSSFSGEIPDPEDPESVVEVEPDGEMYGLDAAYTWGERASAGLGVFLRSDRGDTDNDAAIVALRGSAALTGVTFAGELGIEGGKIQGTDLRGYAYHVDATHTFCEESETYAKASFLFFSGDKTDTEKNEGYYPWFYRWNDWSQYYVGDIVGSTMILNSDARIMVLEGGYKPAEAWGLRLLLHRMDLDTGSSIGGLPSGTSRHFADEVNVVADYTLNDAWSFWAMTAFAKPGDAAKAAYGDDDATELFLNATFSF
jgi:hypothetical protein